MIAAHHETVASDATADKPGKAVQQMTPAIEAALTEHRREFLRYLARRLGDASTAEDVLQSFCLRVVNSGTTLRNSDSVVAWLYTVLRSVLTDYYRSEASRRRREASYTQEQLVLGEDHDDIEIEQNDCNCFRQLIPELRPDYAEVLRRVDLSGEQRKNVAADIGITPTNLGVRLHRARQALRTALGSCCGGCCESGYHDCTCASLQSRAAAAIGGQAARQ